MAACWSCTADAGPGPFCDGCGKIQPGRARDHFEVLGLPRAFHLDLDAIEGRHRDLSRLLHPDKFAKAPPRERRFSLEQSTALNQAVKALKDPIARAEHLLKLEGFEVASEHGSKVGKNLPVAFYEEVMEDREALMEARDQGPDAVALLVKKIEGRRMAALAIVNKAFIAWEESGARDTLAPAVPELAKLRYYDRFMDEVEGRPHH